MIRFITQILIQLSRKALQNFNFCKTIIKKIPNKNLFVVPYSNLETIQRLVEAYLYKHNLVCFKNNLYFKHSTNKILTCTNTWFFYSTLEKAIYQIARDFSASRYFILKNKQHFLDLCLQTELLEGIGNMYLDDFRYIEFNDFMFDMHKPKFLPKHKTLHAFRFFNYKADQLMELLPALLRLKKIFKTERDFILFLQRFAAVLCRTQCLDSTVYVYKPSYLMQQFLVWLYGSHNICVCNSTNAQRLLNTTLSGAPIVIVDAEVFRLYKREFCLKFLNGTFLDLNIKFNPNTGVKSWDHFDSPQSLLCEFTGNEFQEIEVVGTINQFDCQTAIKQSLPLFILFASFSILPIGSVTDELTFENLEKHLAQRLNNFYRQNK